MVTIALSEAAMTGLDPEQTASDRAQRRHYAGGHAEQQDVGLRDPIHPGPEHTAEREHAGYPIPKYRAGKQVVDDVAASNTKPAHR